MNIERFFGVITTIKEEIEELKIANQIQSIETSLNSSVSQPNPQTAKVFTDSLEQLKEVLEKCPSNDFQPSRFKILELIGGTYKTGNGLYDKINEIINEDKITPATALSKIQKLRAEITEFYKNVSQIYQSFEKLNIPTDDLEEGEAEIGILIPKEIIDDSMTGLTKEMHLLERRLLIFAEAAGAPLESFKIRSVGTGSIDIYISSVPVVAACIMTAIERLAKLYKTILEIRVLRKQLEDIDIPKDTTKQLKKDEAEIIKKEIDNISDKLMEKYYKVKDAGRKNELKNALEVSLKFIADRMDRGMDIEADAIYEQEKEEETTGEGEEKIKKVHNIDIQEIQHAGSVLRYLKRSGEPVLQLTEGERKKVEKVDDKETK
jgi:hypothetical protein